jgi:hypothetical protein
VRYRTIWRQAPLIWLVAIPLLSGCNAWKPPATGPEEPWTKSWRTKTDTTSNFGVDTRAREIERNLGVY